MYTGSYFFPDTVYTTITFLAICSWLTINTTVQRNYIRPIISLRESVQWDGSKADPLSRRQANKYSLMKPNKTKLAN